MRPLSKKVRGIKKTIDSLKNDIDDKQRDILKLKAEYPYKQGRSLKSNKQACKNVTNRKKT